MAKRTYRNVAEFTHDLLQDAQRHARDVQSFAEVGGKNLYDAAYELMSGGTSLKTLRRMGHPYARRHALGNPNKRRPRLGSMPPLPINVQSGRLRGSLRYSIVRKPGRWEVEVWVSAPPYDKFVMDGTSKMVARPLRQAMYNRALALRRIARMFVSGGIR